MDGIGAPTDGSQLLAQAVGEEGKEEMASVAEQLEERGFRKGLVLGRREMLLELLRLRFGELPEAVHARVNAANIEELDHWAVQLLSAPTLADVFGRD